MAGTEGILWFLQNQRNTVPFGGGLNWRNMKKESSISERNEKDSCRIPFGGVSDWRNGKRTEQPSWYICMMYLWCSSLSMYIYRRAWRSPIQHHGDVVGPHQHFGWCGGPMPAHTMMCWIYWISDVSTDFRGSTWCHQSDWNGFVYLR